MKRLNFIVLLIILLIVSSISVFGADCGSVPTDDCYINNNTVFTTGTYNVSRMTINASNIVVDCNDSTFENKSDYFFDALNNQENVTLKNCNWYPEGSGQGIRSQNDNLRNWTLDNLYINNKSITTGNYWHNLTYTRTEIYAPTVPDAPSNIQEIIRFNGTLTLKFNNWEIDEIRVQPISDVFGDHSMVLVDLNNFSHLNGSNNNAFEFLNINGAKFYNNTLQEMQLRDSAIGPQAGREIANIDIRDNTISDFATGIDFGFNGNNGTNINIIGNTISGTTTRDMDIVDKTNVTIKNHNTISSEGLMFIRGSNTQPQDYTITDNTFTMAGTTGISITCMSNMTFVNNTIYGNGGGASAGDNRLLRLYGDCSLGTQGQVLMTENSFLNGTDISSLMLGNLGLSNSLEYISVYDNVFSGGIRLSGIWTDNVVVYNNSLTSFEILDGNSWDICNAGVGNIISNKIVVASFGLTTTSHQFESACSPYTIPNGVEVTTSANITTDSGIVEIIGIGNFGINYTGTITSGVIDNLNLTGFDNSTIFESGVSNVTLQDSIISTPYYDSGSDNTFSNLTVPLPTLSSVTPNAGASVSSSTIGIGYTVSTISQINSCTIYVDGNVNSNDTTTWALNTKSNSITKSTSFTGGAHTWQLICTDVFGNTGSISSRALTVDIGGGGGGSGGGVPASLCEPIWFCSDWSACESNSQERTCIDLNSCEVGGSPSLIQQCNTLDDIFARPQLFVSTECVNFEMTNSLISAFKQGDVTFTELFEGINNWKARTNC